MPKRLLMISTDRAIFQEGSAVRARQVEYAREWDEVHIIVFAGREHREQSIAPNCFVYPTRSVFKIMYPFGAIRIGGFIIGRRGITDITCQDSSLTAMAGVALKKERARIGQNVSLEIQVHEDLGSPNFAYSIKNRIRAWMARSYLPQADSIRVVSARIKGFLTERLKIDGSKIAVKPIKVDTDAIKSASVIPGADLRAKYPRFSKIVLMAGRLEPEKNFGLAVRAWPAVVAAQPRAGLIIVGHGSEETRLRSLARSLGVEQSVAFEPWADKPTLISYYKTADLFLNTSLFEGYGMALVEARAAGCPIVSTDVGIAPDIGATIVGWTAPEVAQGLIAALRGTAPSSRP